MPKQFRPMAKSLNEVLFSLITGRVQIRIQLRDADNTNHVLTSYDAALVYDRENDIIIPKLVTTRPIKLKAKHLDRDADVVKLVFNWEVRVDGKVYTCPALKEWDTDKPFVLDNDRELVMS